MVPPVVLLTATGVVTGVPVNGPVVPVVPPLTADVTGPGVEVVPVPVTAVPVTGVPVTGVPVTGVVAGSGVVPVPVGVTGVTGVVAVFSQHAPV